MGRRDLEFRTSGRFPNCPAELFIIALLPAARNFFPKFMVAFRWSWSLVLVALPVLFQKCRTGFSAVCRRGYRTGHDAESFAAGLMADTLYGCFSLLSHLLIAAKGNLPGQRLETSSSSSIPAHSRISANSA